MDVSRQCARRIAIQAGITQLSGRTASRQNCLSNDGKALWWRQRRPTAAPTDVADGARSSPGAVRGRTIVGHRLRCVSSQQ